jgi:hypothetical protein
MPVTSAIVSGSHDAVESRPKEEDRREDDDVPPPRKA